MDETHKAYYRWQAWKQLDGPRTAREVDVPEAGKRLSELVTLGCARVCGKVGRLNRYERRKPTNPLGTSK